MTQQSKSSTKLETRIEIIKCPDLINKEVQLSGWVHSRRDHGQIIFIDLRDRSGIVQLVFSKDLSPKAYLLAQKLTAEDVISITGQVSARPEKMVNLEIPTGKIEISVKELEILNKAANLPFDPTQDTQKINEETRLKYRYLDLRNERLKNNLEKRHQAILFIRNWLAKHDFWEIETAILTKSTPEGARDYLVPSRQQPGKFYALPQSPQQYKQLLQVAGIEKYFQIARCFRDEDPRADRQPEFTQLDLEMSFVKAEDVMQITEELFIELVERVFPKKKISQKPFPKLTYDEAIKKHKTDKPDLRKDPKNPHELAFAWITNWPYFEKTENGFEPHHHIFTSPTQETVKYLDSDLSKVKSSQYDLVLNGYEVGGGSIRITNPEIQKKIFKVVGILEKDAENKFGHMLKAFTFGAPPHGGIAPGLDRIIAILQNEDNIREVIAFPKTGDGRDPLMSSPSEVANEQLKELKIQIKK
ncbi:MAG TPA: aspartate--tRNA ligase [Patescibacteria group bacterium]|nr:aspartate--tRNA ligase [Patescibacteria group bacterium]